MRQSLANVEPVEWDIGLKRLGIAEQASMCEIASKETTGMQLLVEPI